MKVLRETILSPSRQSFLVREFIEPRFSYPYHYHPELEITYIAESSGTRIIGNHIGSFAPGDLCMIGENLPHGYSNPRQFRGRAVSEVLQFDRGMAQGLLDNTPELEAFSRLMDRARLGLAFDSKTGSLAGELLTKLHNAKPTQRWALFFELIHLLCSASPPRVLSSPGYAGSVDLNDTERIHSTCHYILEHFQEDLSHKVLAKRIHVTPAHFSRIFKKATQKTYQEFLTEIRLGHACRLLMETDLPVIEVAFESGFGNLSNFNRRFRQKYAMSPREYRKRVTAAEVD